MHKCFRAYFLMLWNRGVRYHEPEFWKFGDHGNKYFRHATGQLYAISKDLATYISVNKWVLASFSGETHFFFTWTNDLLFFFLSSRHVLHKFANEDVSLGSWFIGLDVQHIDDRRLCCGTPPGESRNCLFGVCVGFDVSLLIHVECRLRMEGAGRQHLCCFVRLELQWDLQIGW